MPNLDFQNHTPERILIVRLTALGDVIHGIPVLNALRDRYPDAHIGWVVEGHGGDLLEGHRALNELIRIPRRWYKSPRAMLAARQQLQSLEFDTAVDLQCLTKSAALAWASKAPRRIGADGTSGRELSKWFNNDLTTVETDHVIDHYLGLLAPLDIENPEVRFDLEEFEVDAQFAERALAKLDYVDNQYVVLNPGAGWDSKLWPTNRYGQVARHLHAEHGMPSLVVWAGDRERQMAEEIVLHSKGTARIAPSTSMRELGAVTRRARAFVGSDTGPMHLAVAVDTPTISLHGASEASRCGAYGSKNIALQKVYEAGSYGERRRADNAAMCEITVEDVNAACDQLLKMNARRLAA